jgi:hypothetical protein
MKEEQDFVALVVLQCNDFENHFQYSFQNQLGNGARAVTRTLNGIEYCPEWTRDPCLGARKRVRR